MGARFAHALLDAATPMLVALMLGAGGLARWWDAPQFEHKGQAADARFARAVGWALIIGGAVLMAAREVLRRLRP